MIGQNKIAQYERRQRDKKAAKQSIQACQQHLPLQGVA